MDEDEAREAIASSSSFSRVVEADRVQLRENPSTAEQPELADFRADDRFWGVDDDFRDRPSQRSGSFFPLPGTTNVVAFLDVRASFSRAAEHLCLACRGGVGAATMAYALLPLAPWKRRLA